MLTVDYGHYGGPFGVHVVNSPSRERWRLADLASWLVTVKENVLVANILSFLKRAPSSPDNMTSQAKTSSTTASATVPSTASPAVATPPIHHLAGPVNGTGQYDIPPQPTGM